MRMLKSFLGTVIVASHDLELLRGCINQVWHIENGTIQKFTGHYDDYIQAINIQRSAIEHELSLLERQKKETHQALMAEQKRASKSQAKGQKSIDRSKWPTIVSHAKAGRAEETSGRKTAAIDNKKQAIMEQLGTLRVSDIIVPKFSITADAVGDGVVVSVHAGAVGYAQSSQERAHVVPSVMQQVWKNIYVSVTAKERIAIVGDNGSGKSTLIKAILGDPNVIRQGDWYAPQDIGYLDQHYATLDPALSVMEVIKQCVAWPLAEIRRHLNDFLFRKNEEVETLVANLSGGEKARLSLAQIAAKTPKLLVLDEMTNNLDLETRAHVIQVLQSYPGAIIAISHDDDFLQQIGVTAVYSVANAAVVRV
jgi:ATPase subunit of ABC transporter with duplicated ATPase domains